MLSTEINRRNFLAVIGVLTAGSVTPALSQLTSTDDPGYWRDNEYLFAPGFIYMNTGTISPCSKKKVEETTALWKQLESLPLQFYPKFAPALAEKEERLLHHSLVAIWMRS